MPRVCAVCSSEHRDAIEDAFLEGQPKTRIASTYGVGEHSIRYHLKEGHLAKLLVLARDTERAARADNLLDRLEALQGRIEAFLSRVEHSDNYGATLGAFREMRATLEVIGEVTKELDRTPTLNLHLNPEWMELRAVIVSALEPHPDARESVLTALEEVGGG